MHKSLECLVAAKWQARDPSEGGGGKGVVCSCWGRHGKVQRLIACWVVHMEGWWGARRGGGGGSDKEVLPECTQLQAYDHL